MPLETQGKILRVLVEQKFQRVGGGPKVSVDVRIISSTSRDLEREMAEGRFREDLYHRLNVVPLRVPGLAERRDDIPELDQLFRRARSAQSSGLAPRKIGEDAIAVLQAHDWPGNVRELRNNIERLLILAGGDPDAIITANMLPEEIGSNVPLPVNGGAEHLMSLPLREAREIFEREYLLAQINRFGGNISRTAEFVGMERSALHRKLQSAGRQLAGARRRRAPSRAQALMTRIVYVNGRYLPLRGGRGACRGSRLPVRRRGLRGVRGQGRPAGRRDAAYAAPGALARRAATCAQPMTPARLVARAARDHPAQPRARRPRLSAGHRAAPARATSRFRPSRRRADASCAWRAASIAGAGSRRAAPRASRVKTMPDIRWGRCDIKTVMLLPTALAKQAARSGGRQGSLVRRRARATSPRAPRPTPGSSTRTGRLITAPDRQRHPARRHPHHPDRSAASARRHRAGGAAVHRGGGQGGAGGLHYLGDQHRHAGGAHRRQADRQRRAGPVDAQGCGPNFIRRPKWPALMPDLPSGSLRLRTCSKSACASTATVCILCGRGVGAGAAACHR